MYAETGLFFPYMQKFSEDFQQFIDYCKTQKPNASTHRKKRHQKFIISFGFNHLSVNPTSNYQSLVLYSTTVIKNNLVQISTISEYDLGGEGDLFKAPEPIIEEPNLGLDPMTAAISLISCGEDVITSQGLKAADIESIQNEQLLEVLYECEKDMMAKAAMETPLSQVLDIKIPVVKINENQNLENKVLSDIPFQKSVSSSCLSSMEWVQGAVIKPNFLDFPGMDFGSVYGMRRAFSEGDIQWQILMLSTFLLAFM
ncbi:hypothetical protein GOBAR_AA08270 [Gossypium barbadense]|uniref:Uncharacterized protein n=1 Tax=Gossypium barbadense TaxID=3634 RepID=A0A2P5Y9U3_GOSBA|nr:hypothetical protein GOBAR_AA08270 [Gossypium barbadense]